MMTEEQKNELAGLCRIEIRRWKHAAEAVPDKRYMVELMELALAALTQPANPALKLPDEMDTDHPRMRWVGIDELWGRIQGWHDCLEEVKRLNAPHTAPIEPICATGGAEWVKVPREPTRQMMSQGHFAMAGTDRGKFRRIYQAMIAAAPQPE